MATNNNNSTRTITLGKAPKKVQIDLDTMRPILPLIAACILENTAFYIYPSKNGQAIKVKLYDTTGPTECWLNVREDLDGQVTELITEYWGDTTLAETLAVMALWGLERAPEAPPEEKPISTSARGRKKL